MLTVHLSKKSSNKKLGGIASSTTSANSCSTDCGLFNVCYAKKGPQSWHWNKVTKGERGTDWLTFCSDVEKLKPNSLFRHNVSGDLPTINGVLDTVKLDQLQCATTNAKVNFYTYTHWNVSQTNRDVIKRFNQPGFVINASTEKIRVAAKYYLEGLDVVITNTGLFNFAVNNLKQYKLPTKINYCGELIKVVPCPEQYTDSATCASCKLCARSNRDFIVCFKQH